MREEELVQRLVRAQHEDGGWGFKGESAATEPTAFAVLALSAAGGPEVHLQGGRSWLTRHQRADGGWAPRPHIPISTYVTAPALVALGHHADGAVRRKGVKWLLGQRNEDSRLVYRMRRALLGVKSDTAAGFAWSWYPETAAWVTPTVLCMLALAYCRTADQEPQIELRLKRGEEYLWARQCADGGWNHGSSRALGYEASSYPETTGQALVALATSKDPRVGQAIETALRHLHACRSTEGICWLILGLAAHKVSIPQGRLQLCQPKSNLEVALVLLARRALSGQHPFVASSYAA